MTGGQDRQNVGLDLLKIIAAFTVVLIHSPNPWHATSQAAVLRMLPPANALFALVAGMLMSGLLREGVEPRAWLRKRIWRLVIPYLIWDAAYMLANTLFDSIGKGTTAPASFPWRLWARCLFFGAGSVQLWFVIMLFYAQTTVALAWWTVRRVMRARDFKKLALVAGVAGCCCYPLLPDESPQRLYVFMLSFVLIGLAFAQLPHMPKIRRHWITGLCVVGLLLLPMLKRLVPLPSMLKPGMYLLTLFLWVMAGCSLPQGLPGRARITQVASCTIGVYLVHVFCTRALLQVSSFSVRILGEAGFPLYNALIAFALSLAVVLATRRWKVLWGS